MAQSTLLQRWTAFNLIGLIGIAVQLGIVALLVRACGWHYLPATVVAVEAAVLHNFAWHQRWTWSDRRSSSRQATVGRLLRFHALNGAVSLGGNIVVTALLSGVLRLDPIAANAVAIVLCAAINFTASERLVFRAASIVLACIALVPVAVRADPPSAALSAWQHYQSEVDARYAAARGLPSGSFLIEDRLGGAGWRADLAGGTVSAMRIDAPAIADGKIHHWVGAVFVPGMTVDRLLAMLKENAGSESRFYDDVVRSRLLWRDGDRLKVFMKLRRTSVVTVTYNTEHQVEYTRLSPARAAARSEATRIVELQDAGTPKEREKSADEDSGFLWRLNAYWRYEQTPGGVIVECESVSLSRPVPLLVRPVANPIVDRIARESLVRTLQNLRRVLAVAPAASAGHS